MTAAPGVIESEVVDHQNGILDALAQRRRTILAARIRSGADPHDVEARLFCEIVRDHGEPVAAEGASRDQHQGNRAFALLDVGNRTAVRLEDALLRHMSSSSGAGGRSEEHTSELQSLMSISYAVFCLK